MRDCVSDRLVMAVHRRTLWLECGKQCHTAMKKESNVRRVREVRGLVCILKLISG